MITIMCVAHFDAPGLIEKIIPETIRRFKLPPSEARFFGRILAETWNGETIVFEKGEWSGADMASFYGLKRRGLLKEEITPDPKARMFWLAWYDLSRYQVSAMRSHAIVDCAAMSFMNASMALEIAVSLDGGPEPYSHQSPAYHGPTPWFLDQTPPSSPKEVN